MKTLISCVYADRVEAKAENHQMQEEEKKKIQVHRQALARHREAVYTIQRLKEQDRCVCMCTHACLCVREIVCVCVCVCVCVHVVVCMVPTGAG